MGYWSSMHLVNVKIKPESVRSVARKIKAEFDWGFKIDSEGFLAFEARQDGLNAYPPDEDGTMPASSAKWYDDEIIARWMRKYSEKGGRMVFYSEEGDGRAWGWEFDGKGRMRPLYLVPVGKWE